MSDEPSLLTVTLDYERQGKQFGHLLVPHSRDLSAWGTLMLPIVCIKNGDGPTVLLFGGNHGDEYEGPVALSELARELDPLSIRGRVIIVPALNLPAVLVGSRVSPVDGGNMNRAFPGSPRGGMTARIAHYVQRELLPRADIVVDLHSGGKSLNFLPAAIMHEFDDPARTERTMAALRAFGAPVGLVLRELDSAGMLDTAAEEMGCLFLSTELGGGGGLTPRTMAVARRGLRNLLVHFDLLNGAIEPSNPPGRVMRTPDGAFVMAHGNGLFEPLVELGDTVQADQPIGRIHDIAEPAREPLLHRAAIPGLTICRRVPGLTERGDCLMVLAQDYDG